MEHGALIEEVWNEKPEQQQASHSDKMSSSDFEKTKDMILKMTSTQAE